MKNGESCSKKLGELLKRLGTRRAPELSDADDPLAVLVMSFLIWESTTARAVAAYKRIRENIVDFNDLRVSLPHEIQEFIGPRYPQGHERCQRLRAALRSIYLREHAVNLDRQRSFSKRDVKRYIDSLDGIVPYVSSRVMLLCFDTHGIPVDEQLRAALVEVGAADASADLGELSSWLARQVKASDGAAAHYALQAWTDAGRKAGAGQSTSRRTGGDAASTRS